MNRGFKPSLCNEIHYFDKLNALIRWHQSRADSTLQSEQEEFNTIKQWIIKYRKAIEWINELIYSDQKTYAEIDEYIHNKRIVYEMDLEDKNLNK